MKKYNREDHIALATWAADCAERVLVLFEQECPEDDRPRRAIETCRTWASTGKFNMTNIRGASLAAHAAARVVKEYLAACFAARAAGQAAATPHVPQHAFGAAYYSLKAVAAADPQHSETNVAKELDWQVQQVAKNLREEVSKRVIIQEYGNEIMIRIQKDKDF